MNEEPIVDPSSDILKQALSSLNVIVESNTSTAGDPGISQVTQHTTLSPTPGLSADDETTTTPGTAEAAAWFLLQAGHESNARCTRSIELLSEPWLTLPPSRLYPFARSVSLELVRTRAMLSMHLQDSVAVHPHRWEQRQWHRAVLRALLAVEPRAKEASLMLWQAGHAIFMRVTRRGLKARLQVEGGGWPSDDTKKDQGDKEWKWDEQSAEEEYDDLSRNCSEPKWFRELREQFLGLRLPGDVVGKESWQLDHKIPPRETTKHIHWSSPYLACRDGFLSPGWSLTISTAFYSFSSHLIPEFRGALALELNLQDVDIDQCATNGGWFSGTHHCDRRREQCIPEKGKGFRLDAYHCICRAGFFMRKQDHLVKADATPEMPRCIPCVPGCSSCSDMTPCIVRARNELRFSLLIAQFFSLALGATLMVYRLIMHRRKKTCCPSLDLKQALLLGACLLHSLVLIHFLEPSSLLCVLSRWMRALGFVCVYGSISLRTNRLARIAFSVRHALARSTAYSFRSLCPALLLCTCLLITWTLSTVGISTQDVVLVMAENLPDGRSYAICIHDAWDYMLALMKMMALFWILWHFHTMRRHLFIFSESWCLTIASVNDLILSLAFNVIRFRLLGPTEPNIDLLLSLLHAHLSVSVTVLLALLPEFCRIWAGAPDVSQQRIQTCHGQSSVCPHGSLGCSSRLDPDDVRGELRRLYARLEEKKGEKMRADNTHLTVQHTSRTVPAALRLCWASQTDHNHELSDADIPRVQGMLKDVDRHLELQSRHPRESSDLFLECETSVENQKVKTAACLQNLNVNALEETPPKLTFVIGPDSSTPRPLRFRSLSAECLMEMHAGWHSVLKQTLSLVEGGKDGLESWDWMNKEKESLEMLHGAATDVCSLNTDLARRSSTIFLNSQEMWSEREDLRVETVTEENNASTNSLCKCNSIDELNKITINQARIEASLKDIPSSPGHSAGRIDNLEELLKQTDNVSEMQDGDHFIISTETKTLSSFTPASRLPVEVGVDSFAIAENNVMNIKLNVDSCPCKDWHNEATSDKFMNANQHPENCPGKQNESAKHILSTQTTSEHGEETCSLPLSHWRPLRESLSKVCALDKTSSHSTVGREILFAEICPWEKIDISMTHSGEALQSEVCPWKKNDSQTAEILQSKSSSSGKAEISLAHWKTLRDSISKVCPQDKKDIAQKRHISLSEICPWENTDESAVVKIETPIPDFTPKSGEHHLSEICPWEKVCDSSNDNKDIMQVHNEQLGKTDIALAHWRKVKESLSKIDPLDNRGIFSNPSRKISLSEICPWEKIEEAPTQRKEACLSDICPWEETVISVTKNANYLAESTNDPSRADISLAHCGKVRESISKICHPENKAVLDIKGREILSQVHPREKIDDSDESSKEFLISEICPWDKTDTSSAENKNNFQSKTDLSEETDLSLGHWGKVKDSLSQICTLDKKERSDSQSRTNVLAEICPWEIIEEDETLRKEILLSESCPWENTDISASQSEDALQSENDPRKRTDASLAHWRKVRDSFLQLSSSSKRAASTSQSKRTSFTEICPWENTDLPVNQSVETLQSRKTDVTLANWKKVRDSISHINPLDKKNLSALQSRKTFLCEVCPWEISDDSDAHNKDAEMIPCEKVVEPALVSTDTMLSKNESSGKTNLSLAHWKKVRDSLSVICPLDKSDFSVSPRRKTLLSDICPWENSDMSVFQVNETSLLENTGDIDKTNATFVNNLHTQHSRCLLETGKSDSKGTQSVEQMVIETEDICNEEFKNNDSGREVQVKGELHDLPIDKIAINFCEAEQSHLRHCFEDAGTGSGEKEDGSHDSKSMGDVESKSVVGVKSISTETQTQKARVLWTQAITSTRKLKQKSVSKENEKLDIAPYQKIKVLTSGEGCGQSSTQSTEYRNASDMHRIKPIQSPGHDGSIPRLDTIDLASKASEDKVRMKGCDGSLPEAHSYSGDLKKIKEQEVQCENFSCDIGTQDMNTGEIWVGKIGQDIMNGKRVNRKQTSGQIVEEIKETPSLKRGEYTRNREASGIEKGDANKAKGRRKKKMENTEHMQNVQLSHCGTQTNVRTDHRVRGQAKAQRGMKANTYKGAEGGSSQIGVHNSCQPSTQGIVQITPDLCNRTQEPQNTVVQEVMKQEGNTKECIETCTIVSGETSPISTKLGCKQGLLKQTHRRLGPCTTISIDKLYTGLNTNSPETETSIQPPEHHGKHVAE